MAFNDPQMIKAVIGNAGAVALKVNGADLGVVGADGEVADLNHNLHQLRSGILSSFLADVRYNCGSRLTFKNTKKFEKL